MRILITGGAGFIASNVAHRLLRDGWRVRLFGNLSRPGVEQNAAWLEAAHGGCSGRGEPKIEVILGDVRNAAAIRRNVVGTQVAS